MAFLPQNPKNDPPKPNPNKGATPPELPWRREKFLEKFEKNSQKMPKNGLFSTNIYHRPLLPFLANP